MPGGTKKAGKSLPARRSLYRDLPLLSAALEDGELGESYVFQQPRGLLVILAKFRVVGVRTEGDPPAAVGVVLLEQFDGRKERGVRVDLEALAAVYDAFQDALELVGEIREDEALLVT